MEEKFKLKGVGIDTSTMVYSPTENEFDYIVTDISSNNITKILNFVNIKDESQLITNIDFLDCCEEAIKYHLVELNRDKIDLLLIDSKCDIVKYSDSLLNLIKEDFVVRVGIKNPDSIEKLEEIKSIIPDLKYIAIDICPLNFDYNIIEWCNNNDVEIIGFNVLGGRYISQELIDTFTVPYLLGFASTYCSIIILSGRDPLLSSSDLSYLDELMSLDSVDLKYYKLNKTVKKQIIKPLKKCIDCSLILDENLTLPLSNVDELFSFSELKLTLGTNSIENNTDPNRKHDELEELVLDCYNKMKKPEDSNNPGDLISLLRPCILLYMREKYKEKDDWVVYDFKVSNELFIISATNTKETKHIFKKTEVNTKVINYVLYYNGVDFIFQKLEKKEDEA